MFSYGFQWFSMVFFGLSSHIESHEHRPLGHLVEGPHQRRSGLAVRIAMEGGDEEALRLPGGADGDQVARLQGGALHGGQDLLRDVRAGRWKGLFSSSIQTTKVLRIWPSRIAEF